MRLAFHTNIFLPFFRIVATVSVGSQTATEAKDLSATEAVVRAMCGKHIALFGESPTIRIGLGFGTLGALEMQDAALALEADFQLAKNNLVCSKSPKGLDIN